MLSIRQGGSINGGRRSSNFCTPRESAPKSF